MLAVYNYMASGLLLTGIVALFVVNSTGVRAVFFTASGAPTLLGWIAVFAPLALVFTLSFGINRLSLLLGLLAWAMLRYSRDLPIAKFFAYSAWLMAILTIVLAGKGVSALQEAGIIDIAPLGGGVRVSMLGIFPTLQSMGAQLLMLIAVLGGFLLNRRRAAVAVG
jgi:high-affinity Fe2+/Pb2+ permease